MSGRSGRGSGGGLGGGGLGGGLGSSGGTDWGSGLDSDWGGSRGHADNPTLHEEAEARSASGMAATHTFSKMFYPWALIALNVFWVGGGIFAFVHRVNPNPSKFLLIGVAIVSILVIQTQVRMIVSMKEAWAVLMDNRKLPKERRKKVLGLIVHAIMLSICWVIDQVFVIVGVIYTFTGGNVELAFDFPAAFKLYFPFFGLIILGFWFLGLIAERERARYIKENYKPKRKGQR